MLWSYSHGTFITDYCLCLCNTILVFIFLSHHCTAQKHLKSNFKYSKNEQLNIYTIYTTHMMLMCTLYSLSGHALTTTNMFFLDSIFFFSIEQFLIIKKLIDIFLMILLNTKYMGGLSGVLCVCISMCVPFQYVTAARMSERKPIIIFELHQCLYYRYQLLCQTNTAFCKLYAIHLFFGQALNYNLT